MRDLFILWDDLLSVDLISLEDLADLLNQSEIFGQKFEG